ncbi:MAG TPA: hypothetical protein VNT30_18885 [Stellaceae bacterium]|nr:hypothetical protein [Stellaceae bacterium]
MADVAYQLDGVPLYERAASRPPASWRGWTRSLPTDRIAGALAPRTIAMQSEYAECEGFTLLQFSIWQRSRLPWRRDTASSNGDRGNINILMSLTHLASGRRVVDQVRPRTGLARGTAVEPVRQPARPIAPCIAVIIADRVAIAIGEGSRLVRLDAGVYQVEATTYTVDGAYRRRRQFSLFTDYLGRCRGVWR